MPLSRFLGTGLAVPDRVVTNDDLSQLMDTSDQWIRERTGIRERRWVREGETGGQLALAASGRALEAASLAPAEVEAIVYASSTPDHFAPGNGVYLQRELGAGPIPAIDIRTQCSGFVYALAVADAFIRIGTYQRVLVVGAEALSTMLEYSDRGRDMAVLFADGAGAVVLQSVDGSSRSGFISHHLHQDGTVLDKLFGEIYGSSTYPIVSKKKIDEGRARPTMNGRAIFSQAVRRFKEVMREALTANDLTPDDVDFFLFHQANQRILDAIAEYAKIPEHKMFNNVHKYGNTSAASVPICIHEAYTAGRIREGDLVLTAAFGAGFAWGASLFRW